VRWSKVKQLVEARFASELHGRLSVELTKYRKPTRSENGELFVVLDGRKIFSAAEFRALKLTNGQYYRDTEKFHGSGITSEFWALADLTESLNWSIDDFFDQSNPLLRGLAVADARFGRRRMAGITIEDEPDLVRAILCARKGTVETFDDATPRQ